MRPRLLALWRLVLVLLSSSSRTVVTRDWTSSEPAPTSPYTRSLPCVRRGPRTCKEWKGSACVLIFIYRTNTRVLPEDTLQNLQVGDRKKTPRGNHSTGNHSLVCRTHICSSHINHVDEWERAKLTAVQYYKMPCLNRQKQYVEGGKTQQRHTVIWTARTKKTKDNRSR